MGRDFQDVGVRFLHSYFDLAASRYGVDIEPAFAPLAEGLVEFADIAGPTRAIDLGTGTGLVARIVMPRVGHLCAVDISRLMLAKARRSGVTHVAQADLHRLPFRNGGVGLALASFAFNSSDPTVAFREVFRIVEPGGRLVFQEWGMPDDLSEIVSDTLASYAVDEPPDDLRQLREGTELPVPWDDLETLDDIEEAVAAAGFAVNRVDVLDAEVRMASLDAYLRYKLAWPSRQAEVDAMPDDVRRLMLSDLQENLRTRCEADGSLLWRPQVIRINATKPGVAVPG